MAKQDKIWDFLYKTRLSWKKETSSLPKILKNKSVLEVGVGNGKTLKAILRQNPKSVLAIDISNQALNLSRDNFRDSKVKFIKGDISSFKSPEKFDVIICYYVLNNMKKDEIKLAVKNMALCLKDGGTILFEDFAAGDFRQKQKRKDRLSRHFFTQKEVKSLFRNFKGIKIKQKVSSPLRGHPELKRGIISAIIKSERAR